MKTADEICNEMILKINPIFEGNEKSHCTFATMKMLVGLLMMYGLTDQKIKESFVTFVDETIESRKNAMKLLKKRNNE